MFDRGLPHCKQCGYEMDGGEESCPRCRFNPKQKGLRVASGFLMAMVLLVSLAMVSTFVVPGFSGPMLVLAALSFVLALVTFFVSFAVTPYRFGGLFKRF